MKEEWEAGREKNEGEEAGREERGVMDVVKEEGKAQRDRKILCTHLAVYIRQKAASAHWELDQ